MQFPPVDWGKINVIAIIFIGEMQPYGSLWFLSYVTKSKLLKYLIKGGNLLQKLWCWVSGSKTR